MSAFEDYVYERAREAVVSIPTKIAADIYALSFYFWADEDDAPRHVDRRLQHECSLAQLHARPRPTAQM